MFVQRQHPACAILPPSPLVPFYWQKPSVSGLLATAHSSALEGCAVTRHHSGGGTTGAGQQGYLRRLGFFWHRPRLSLLQRLFGLEPAVQLARNIEYRQ